MRHMTQSRLDEIERRYDPEFDLPASDTPPVTWAEHYLLETVRELIVELERVRDEIEELKKRDFISREELYEILRRGRKVLGD